MSMSRGALCSLLTIVNPILLLQLEICQERKSCVLTTHTHTHTHTQTWELGVDVCFQLLSRVQLFCNPVACGLPGSSGMVAISFSRRSFWGGDWTKTPALVPGASARNSACGKGHEEGGSAYAKAGSSLKSPPGNSRASTPKTRVCLLYCFVLSPTPLTLRGAVPHHLSLEKS